MSETGILAKLKTRAKQLQRTIILPEAEDERILESVKVITEQKLARVILLASSEKINTLAADIGLDLSRVETVFPYTSADMEKFSEEFYQLRRHKGITIQAAKEQMHNLVYFAAMMVRRGTADGFVAGASHTTADVARAAIYCLGLSEKVKTLSSCFLVSVPECNYGEQGVFVFADCGIIPDPTAVQLAQIAWTASSVFKVLVETEPRVALLSFSSKGSATHPMVDKIVQAHQIIKEKFPDLISDGELQLDAAIVPEVAKIKASQSEVAGVANVLIFPSLDAGNIAYKLAQRLARADVVGPLMLGLRRPCSDLSRGCTIDEIVNTVCATAVCFSQ